MNFPSGGQTNNEKREEKRSAEVWGVVEMSSSLLLLLDEGDSYLEDRGARLHTVVVVGGGGGGGTRTISGRLFLSTRALFFVPTELSSKSAIVRITLAKLIYMGVHDGRFVLRCADTTYMKPLSAYQVDSTVTDHVFGLEHCSVEAFLTRVRELHAHNSNFKEGNAELMRIVDRHQAEHMMKPFDLSLLSDFDEQILHETMCLWVTPLLKSSFRLVVSSRLLYLQPMSNMYREPVFRFELSSIEMIYRRRHMHKETGLELLLGKPEDKELYLSFPSAAVRDEVHQLLGRHPVTKLSLNTRTHHEQQVRWQRGLLSNFEYLMHLNQLADRTSNDLAAYPVFPWVLANYSGLTLDLNDPKSYRDLSKPVGALNPERLEMFRERLRQLEETGEEPFLYGTHYSTPGYVLFYLVRSRPELMLRLQGGKFDSPDRSFYSVASCWASCLTSAGDVKELIPEFFVDESFLVNAKHLDLGTRQNGSAVDDVELPPWAEGSAKRFIELNRAALESEYVSQHLHLWIDLIFGCKQRGEEARAADNLFYPLTYQGAIDIDSVEDPVQRASMEAQVAEFGQTPKQLFFAPHPQRLPRSEWNNDMLLMQSEGPVSEEGGVSDPFPMLRESGKVDVSGESGFEGATTTTTATTTSTTESSSATTTTTATTTFSLLSSGILGGGSGGKRASIMLNDISILPRRTLDTFRLHRDSVTGLSVEGNLLASVCKDGTLKVHELSRKQIRQANVAYGSPLSACEFYNPEKVLVGAWDSKVYIYSVAFNRCTDELLAHDDAVTALHHSHQTDSLITGGSDTQVRLWKARASGYEPIPIAQLYEVESEVLSVHMHGPCFVAGGANGNVLFGDTRVAGSFVKCEHSLTGDACRGVRILPDGVTAICGSRLLSFSSNVPSVSLPIGTSDASVCSLALSAQSLAAVGLSNGEFQLFDCTGGGARQVGESIRIPEGEGAISCMACTPTSGALYFGLESGTCVAWE